MVLITTVNGTKRAKEKVEVLSFGVMVVSTRAIGRMTKSMATED